METVGSTKPKIEMYMENVGYGKQVGYGEYVVALLLVRFFSSSSFLPAIHCNEPALSPVA